MLLFLSTKKKRLGKRWTINVISKNITTKAYRERGFLDNWIFFSRFIPIPPVGPTSFLSPFYHA